MGKKKVGEKEWSLKVSFCEIYKEELRDLLGSSTAKLQIRQARNGSIYVENLTEEYVCSAEEIIDLIAIGEKSRSVSSTDMNATSSRSHSVFIISVEQKSKERSISAKLNLIDLAGSEKVSKTNAKVFLQKNFFLF